MATYILPTPKRSRETPEVAISSDMSDEFPTMWEREIRIPVSPAIIRALEIGDESVIMLKGRVSELTDTKSDSGNNRTMVTLVISEVKTQSEDESNEEDFSEGFNKIKKY